MSLPSAKPIAFNRRLNAEWLYEGLRLAAAGENQEAWLRQITARVKAEVGGEESARKSMRYLRHIFIETSSFPRLRAEAFALYQSSPEPNRETVLSWGLTTLAYPFLNEAAATIGRLHRVQPHFKLEQFLRRLCDTFGEKETVRRSGRYLLGMLVDLGYVQRVAAGTYTLSAPREIRDDALAGWLLKTWFVINSPGTPIDRTSLSQHPSLCFFNASHLVESGLRSATLTVDRMSFTQDTVTLSVDA
jgi:hypothetical protein